MLSSTTEKSCILYTDVLKFLDLICSSFNYYQSVGNYDTVGKQFFRALAVLKIINWTSSSHRFRFRHTVPSKILRWDCQDIFRRKPLFSEKRALNYGKICQNLHVVGGFLKEFRSQRGLSVSGFRGQSSLQDGYFWQDFYYYS
jgi:hypothetical protein